MTTKLFLFLVLLLSGIRFINLDKIPIFGDEALYLYLANNMSSNISTPFDSIAWGVMPIAIWVLAFIDKLIPNFTDSLGFGRFVMVTTDLISVFFVYKIANILFNQKVAILSTIIYLSLPLNFFHSRLVLLDSLTNTFVLGALYFSFRLEKILFISVFLVLGFFTKPIAIVSYPALFLIPFLHKVMVKKSSGKIILHFFFILVITAVILAVFYLPISKEFTSRFVSSSEDIRKNLWRVFWWSRDYLTLPIMLLFTFGSIYGMFKKSWRLVYLGVWALVIVVLDSLFSANFYPRHLYPLVGPISLMIGYLFYKFFISSRFLSIFLFFLILIPLFNKNFLILTNPYSALALEDKQQFYEDWTSGAGNNEIAQKLEELSKDQKISVFVENLPMQTWVFTNLYNLKNVKIHGSNHLLKGAFVEGSTSGQYLILNRNPVAPVSWPIRLIYSYPKGPNRTINLYKIK